jgi:hypothetical protein
LDDALAWGRFYPEADSSFYPGKLAPQIKIVLPRRWPVS